MLSFITFWGWNLIPDLWFILTLRTCQSALIFWASSPGYLRTPNHIWVLGPCFWVPWEGSRSWPYRSFPGPSQALEEAIQLQVLSVGWEVLLCQELYWEALSWFISVQGPDNLMHDYSQAMGCSFLLQASWCTFYGEILMFACSPFYCWSTCVSFYFSGLPETDWPSKEFSLN